MSELKEYLGSSIMEDIKISAKSNISEFIKQTPATKLTFADRNRYELEIYKQSVPHIINMMDDVGAENELLEGKIKFLKKKYIDLKINMEK